MSSNFKKCSNCGFVQEDSTAVFCMKCGQKYSDTPNIGNFLNSFQVMIENTKKIKENIAIEQGLDYEKVVENERKKELSLEEMRGKSFVEIHSLRLDKEKEFIEESFNDSSKKLAIEFFYIVKPKYQNVNPDRDNMIIKMQEYVFSRYKELVKQSTFVMIQLGNNDKSTYTKEVNSIFDIIDYKPKSSNVPPQEIPLQAFKNAYYSALELVDEYIECCRRGETMREFAQSEQIISNPLKKDHIDKPTKKIRDLD